MPEHFTRNTVSVEFFCAKCQKRTQHRIDDGRKGPCLECIERLERQHESHEPSKQQELFDASKRTL